MTFSEAAVEVLKSVGKPLHYKKITAIAIERNLLSHVGRSPEVTMSARLAALVTRDRGDGPIIRLAPGIFGLREWGESMPVDQEEIDREVVPPEPAVEEVLPEGVSVGEPEDEADGEGEAGADGEEAADVEAEPEVDVAAEEAPAVGDEEEEEDEDRDGEGPGRGVADESDEPGDRSAETQDADADDEGDEEEGEPEAAVEGEADVEEETRRARRREGVSAEPGGEEELDLSDEYVRETFKDTDPTPEERPGRRKRRRRRGRRGAEEAEVREEPSPATPKTRTVVETAGEIARLLLGQERSGGVPVRQLVDMASKRRLIPSGVGNAAQWLQGLLRTDNARRLFASRRPRFRALGSGRWGLWEWGIGGDAAELGVRVEEAAERQRDATRRKLQRKIADLPAPSFEQIVLLLFARLGYGQIEVVARVEGEFHFRAIERRSISDSTIAVVARRDQNELAAERVAAFRGALHHFGAAQGWLLTTGPVSAAAKQEAAAPVVAPIEVTDGAGLARICQENGVGTTEVAIRTVYLDLDFFDALKP